MAVIHEVAKYIYQHPELGMLPCDIWKIKAETDLGIKTYSSLFNSLRHKDKWSSLVCIEKHDNQHTTYGSAKLLEPEKEENKGAKLIPDIEERQSVAVNIYGYHKLFLLSKEEVKSFKKIEIPIRLQISKTEKQTVVKMPTTEELRELMTKEIDRVLGLHEQQLIDLLVSDSYNGEKGYISPASDNPW